MKQTPDLYNAYTDKGWRTSAASATTPMSATVFPVNFGDDQLLTEMLEKQVLMLDTLQKNLPDPTTLEAHRNRLMITEVHELVAQLENTRLAVRNPSPRGAINIKRFENDTMSLMRRKTPVHELVHIHSLTLLKLQEQHITLVHWFTCGYSLSDLITALAPSWEQLLKLGLDNEGLWRNCKHLIDLQMFCEAYKITVVDILDRVCPIDGIWAFAQIGFSMDDLRTLKTSVGALLHRGLVREQMPLLNYYSGIKMIDWHTMGLNEHQMMYELGITIEFLRAPPITSVSSKQGVAAAGLNWLPMQQQEFSRLFPLYDSTKVKSLSSSSQSATFTKGGFK